MPDPEPGALVVRVTRANVCGSDLHIWRGDGALGAMARADGRIIVMTPQEAGFRSDPTHVEFVDLEKIRDAVEQVGFTPVREYSFPFPRPVGRICVYNEFVSVSRRRMLEIGD